MQGEVYEAYYTLACRILEVVVRDYRWAYMRHRQGYIMETRWRSERANFRGRLMNVLTDHVLHITPEDLLIKIERSVDREEALNARHNIIHKHP